MPPQPDALVLTNRHIGESLSLRRIARGGEVWLELQGSLPAHREGPPLHVHLLEDEEGEVVAGTLSAVVDGRTIQVPTGQPAAFPKGSVHRWWNGGDETLAFEGYVKPVVDLDVYLQSAFDVLNAGQAGRPSLFYMAHLAWRHRRTQQVRIAPAWLQALLFPLVVGLGTLLGRFLVIVPMLALAGNFARKAPVPPSLGTFPVTTPLFSALLVSVIVIVGVLTFFPVLSLGPVVEHLLLARGATF